MPMLRLLLILVCLLAGCTSDRRVEESPSEQEWIDAKRREMLEDRLPKGAKVIEALGNEWYIVEFTSGSTSRRVLLRWWWGSHSEFAMAFTELR